jgi:hypothetical protein
MAKLTWKAREYKGVITNFARFTGELKSIASTPSVNEDSGKRFYKCTIVDANGVDRPAIMNEFSFEQGVEIGNKYLCEVTTADGKEFYHSCSHLAGGSIMTAEEAASDYGFTGFMETIGETYEVHGIEDRD